MPDTTKPVPITISDAEIHGEGGDITGATITGNAVVTSVPPVSPGIPAHPILVPPVAPPGSFYLLCFCPNPPPPHWEWILFTPGSPPERPVPTPPPIDELPPGIGGGIPDKPFPPDGGWGYKEPWGWIYWPGPGGASPKRGR